jgi:membrane associated rhomboid family serine protease
MTEDSVPQAPVPVAAPPEQVIAGFHAFLRTVTPRAWLVPSIVAANVAVFGIMVLRGVSPISPRAEDLIAWGANFGPLTLSGEPGRLLANAFLHFGLVHLAMNMLALWDAGRLAERLFGQARFAAIYLGAAVCGSAVSLAVHPNVVSAGASGAVFGVYGAIAGFLVRERGAIPGPALSKLKRVAWSFLGYNLVFGLAIPNIDLAAHLGGAVTGVLAGAFLARPLAPGRASGGMKIGVVAAACGLAVAAAYPIALWRGRPSLEVRRFPGFSIALPRGTVLEDVGAYAAGKQVLRADSIHSAIIVGWQPGDIPAEGLELLARGIGSSLGANASARVVKVSGPAQRDVDTVLIEGRTRLRLSSLSCGRRSVVVASAGPVDPDDLHRRILASFECQFDPQLDPYVDVVPVKLELSGWSATDRTGGQVILSDGRSILLVRNTVFASHTTLKQVVTAAFTAMFRHLNVEDEGSDSATFTGTLGNGEHLEGFVRALRCPTVGVLLLLGAPDPATAGQLRGAVTGARCTAPGEEPSSWPDATPPRR